MRMHCQFCQKPCKLIRSSDKRYVKWQQQWECKNHPDVVSIIYVVRYREKSARTDGNGHRVYGKVREWSDTIVTWRDPDNLNYYEAHYHRHINSDHPSQPSVPFSFQVLKLGKTKRKGNSYRDSVVMVLKEHPAYLTPENIAAKVKTYVVFS